MLSSVTLVGFTGDLYWAFDLFSHFRVQYYLIGGVVFVFALLVRSGKAATLALFLVMVNGICIVPYSDVTSLFTGAEHTPSSQKAVNLNLSMKNTDYQAVSNFLRAESPDIAAFQEVTGDWHNFLDTMDDLYPYRIIRHYPRQHGLAILSKVPLSNFRESFYAEGSFPIMSVTVNFPEMAVSLLVTHFRDPSNQLAAKIRDQSMTGLIDRIKVIDGPLILMADLNMTPWSRFFKRLADDVMLEAQAQRSPATWPTFFWPMRIPIDYILTRGSIRILKKWTGPYVGSDHFPLVASFRLQRKKMPTD